MTKGSKYSRLTDSQIRLALKQRLFKYYKRNKNTRIIDEFGIMHGSIRIDLVVIGKLLHGYEFKSDADTLRRLPTQMKNYNVVFDKMTLVVGYQHINNAIKIIPNWWGIIITESDENGLIRLYDFRIAQDNPQVEPIAQLRLLWKKEALSLLSKYMSVLKLQSKSREVIYNTIAELLDQKKIHTEVIRKLINRANSKSVGRQTQGDG